MPLYSQSANYNYQTPYYNHHSSSPYSAQAYYSSPPSHSAMPTYQIETRRSSSRSGSRHTPPVIFQTPSGHQYYPTSRDYAYSDGGHGRRRRASSVGHGGHYSTAYYPPPARSSRSGRDGHSPREYTVSSSGRRRSHSQTRPVYYETPHHHSGSRRPSVSYSDSGHHHSHSHSRPRRHSESLGDKFRRWFGGGHSHHDSGKFEYVDARTGRPVDKSGRPIYRV